MNVIIIGGGAAGFFAAITCAEANPRAQVLLLERSQEPLGKVRISGGGRCNVTHNLFDPALLTGYYPRGGRALRGPLTRFGPKDTIAWFRQRGVELKAEPDGRMFPTTDSSETIIDTLMGAAERAGVKLWTKTSVTSLSRSEGGFRIGLQNGGDLSCDKLLLATGSAPKGFSWAQDLGHTIAGCVPSLFTFNIKDPRLEGLSGVSVPQATVRLEGTKLEQTGPLLVTHWGLSGPAVLKLSAWAARNLHERNYDATLLVNFLPEMRLESILETLQRTKTEAARKTVSGNPLFNLPQRLWRSLVTASGIADEKRWADVSKLELQRLSEELGGGRYRIHGKGVFKEEFVTCGGVSLKEVDFKTMASRMTPGLYFAGEILDIDGVTGGFNFQNAWTTGYLAGRAMAGAA